MNKPKQKEKLAPSRREFLKSSAAAVVGGTVASHLGFVPAVYPAGSDLIRVGLIGCGGRGTGAATDVLQAAPNVKLVAMGDAFKDRLETSRTEINKEAGDKMDVPDDRCFVGFDAYEKVLASGVDYVVLATPPGFRPLHLKAAVAAGKHVFAEKPVAVDGPGIRTCLEVYEQAKAKNLGIASGTQYRHSTGHQETIKRLHGGAIGQIVAARAYFNTGELWVKPRQPGWTDMEYQMRNWYYFTWLSGDHLVEQAVHTIDKMAWAMGDVPPLRAVAHGGRQVRTGPEFGHIFDHFAVVYEYANEVRGFIFCRQQDKCASGTSDYITGTKGFCKVLGAHQITGENPWNYSGPNGNMYQLEHKALFASIRAGKPLNEGVRMAYSTLVAIQGRMAAYTGQSITWEQALNSKEDLTPPRLAWDQPMAMPPVALPGKTPFI